MERSKAIWRRKKKIHYQYFCLQYVCVTALMDTKWHFVPTVNVKLCGKKIDNDSIDQCMQVIVEE